MSYFFEQEVNQELKKAKGRIPYWVIAKKLNKHEVTVNRWFRSNLTQEKKEKILKAIEEIKQETNER